MKALTLFLLQHRTKLKKQISTRENIPQAFADAAAEHSSCPSGRKGKIVIKSKLNTFLFTDRVQWNDLMNLFLFFMFPIFIFRRISWIFQS